MKIFALPYLEMAELMTDIRFRKVLLKKISAAKINTNATIVMDDKYGKK